MIRSVLHRGTVQRAINLVGILVTLAGSAWAQVPAKEDVLANKEYLLKWGHEHISDSPDLLDQVLDARLARFVGDDPRVLALCEEVIEKSTNTANVRPAVECIAAVLETYHSSVATQQYPDIARELHLAMKRSDDPRVETLASSIFGEMGSSYESDIAGIFRERFRRARLKRLPDSAVVGAAGCVWTQEAADLCAEMIRKRTDDDIIPAITNLSGGPYLSSAKAVELLRGAVARHELSFRARSLAVRQLEQLGGASPEEAYRLSLGLLDTPGNLSGDNECWNYILEIRRILEMHRPDSYATIKRSLGKCPVMKRLEDDANKNASSSNNTSAKLLYELNALPTDGDRK